MPSHSRPRWSDSWLDPLLGGNPSNAINPQRAASHLQDAANDGPVADAPAIADETTPPRSESESVSTSDRDSLPLDDVEPKFPNWPPNPLPCPWPPGGPFAPIPKYPPGFDDTGLINAANPLQQYHEDRGYPQAFEASAYFDARTSHILVATGSFNSIPSGLDDQSAEPSQFKILSRATGKRATRSNVNQRRSEGDNEENGGGAAASTATVERADVRDEDAPPKKRKRSLKQLEEGKVKRIKRAYAKIKEGVDLCLLCQKEVEHCDKQRHSNVCGMGSIPVCERCGSYKQSRPDTMKRHQKSLKCKEAYAAKQLAIGIVVAVDSSEGDSGVGFTSDSLDEDDDDVGERADEDEEEQEDEAGPSSVTIEDMPKSNKKRNIRSWGKKN